MLNCAAATLQQFFGSLQSLFAFWDSISGSHSEHKTFIKTELMQIVVSYFVQAGPIIQLLGVLKMMGFTTTVHANMCNGITI